MDIEDTGKQDSSGHRDYRISRLFLMAKDPIIDEVRRNRKEIAERFNYDLRAIVAAAQKRQKAHGRRVVSFARGRKKRTA
jgi:hypothetical protein